MRVLSVCECLMRYKVSFASREGEEAQISELPNICAERKEEVSRRVAEAGWRNEALIERLSKKDNFAILISSAVQRLRSHA